MRCLVLQHLQIPQPPPQQGKARHGFEVCIFSDCPPPQLSFRDPLPSFLEELRNAFGGMGGGLRHAEGPRFF